VSHIGKDAETFLAEWLEQDVGRGPVRRNPRGLPEKLAAWHHVQLPPEFKRWLDVREHRSFTALLQAPVELDDACGNVPDTFEELLRPNFRLELAGLFSGHIPLAYLPQSRCDVWVSVSPETPEATLNITTPDWNMQFLSKGIAPWFAAAHALRTQEPADPAWAGRLNPIQDFAVFEDLPPIAFDEPALSQRHFRNWWLLQFLSPQWDLAQVTDVFVQWARISPKLQTSIDAGRPATIPFTALYLMWRTYVLDHPRHAELCQIAGTQTSPVVRQVAELFAGVANGRTIVGEVNIVERRREFLESVNSMAPDLLAALVTEGF